MPRVPVYDAATVAPSNLPDFRQSVPYHLMQNSQIMAGEQAKTGQGLISAGREALVEAAQEQAIDNENQAKTIDTNVVRSMDETMYGKQNEDGSFSPGYSSKEGQDAVDSFQPTKDALLKIQQQAVENAPNEATRRIVQQITDQRITSYLGAAERHAAGQRVVAEQQSSNLRMAAGKDAATTSFDALVDGKTITYDPTTANLATRSPYQQALGTVYSELQQQAAKLPDPAARAEFVKEGMAKVYAGVTLHLANIGQATQAKDYLDQLTTKQAIPQDVADKLKETIAPDLTADKVWKYTDKLFDTVQGDKAQLAQVRKDFEAGTINGNERSLIENRIKAKANEAEVNANKYEANAVGQAQNFFVQNPGADLLDLQKKNPQVYRALEQKGHLAALDAFSKRESDHTDPVVKSNVVSHYGTGDAMDILKMNDKDFQLLSLKLSKKDFDTYRKIRDAGTDNNVGDPGSVRVQDFRGALGNRLSGIGIDPKKMKSESDKSYLGAVMQYAEDWVVADQKAAGKKFNSDEVGQSLDRLFAKDINFRTQYLGGMFSSDSSQKMISMKVKDIPRDAYNGIKKILGPTATDQDILIRYWKLHGNK